MDTQEPKMIKLNVSVDSELHKELRRLGLDSGEPLTQLVPRLLREAVKTEKAKPKPAA